MNMTFEQRMLRMADQIADIHAHIVMGQAAVPGAEQLEQAMKDLEAGDPRTLDLYVRRGGKPPSISGRVERPSAQPTAGRRQPVQALRGSDQGAKELRQG